MAFCVTVDKPGQTDEQAEQLLAVLRAGGTLPPEGARLVMAGPTERGWRTVVVWDCEQAYERFVNERLVPAYAKIGMTLDDVQRTKFELSTLIAGDLTPAPETVGV